MYTCVGEGEALTEKVDHLCVFKMLIVSDSMSLTGVIHEEDFENINNSFRRCHRQRLVHMKLNKPEMSKKLAALSIVRNTVTGRTAVHFLPDNDLFQTVLTYLAEG